MPWRNAVAQRLRHDAQRTVQQRVLLCLSLFAMTFLNNSVTVVEDRHVCHTKSEQTAQTEDGQAMRAVAVLLCSTRSEPASCDALHRLCDACDASRNALLRTERDAEDRQ
jgi:hypothetical protein